MGVDRTKNSGLRDRHEFESVYRSRLRRTPTKFRHIPVLLASSRFKPIGHHVLPSSPHHRCRVLSTESSRSRGSARGSRSPRRSLLSLARKQKSPRKNHSLSRKYRKFYRGYCQLSTTLKLFNMNMLAKPAGELP